MSGSAEDVAIAGVILSFSLARVNRLFHSISLNTPSLWSTVSNRQPAHVLQLCIQRSKTHPLCVVLHLGEKNQISKFLKTLAPHTSRWREFYCESDENYDFFVLRVPDLWKLCRGLDLPQLRKLTLIYPIPSYLGRMDYRPEVREIINRYNPGHVRYHFYHSWKTPKLHSVSAKNVLPYHTEGSQIVSYDVLLTGLADRWDCKPLLSMYPHWSKLRHLSLQFDTHYCGSPNCAGSHGLW